MEVDQQDLAQAKPLKHNKQKTINFTNQAGAGQQPKEEIPFEVDSSQEGEEEGEGSEEEKIEMEKKEYEIDPIAWNYKEKKTEVPIMMAKEMIVTQELFNQCMNEHFNNRMAQIESDLKAQMQEQFDLKVKEIQDYYKLKMEGKIEHKQATTQSEEKEVKEMETQAEKVVTHEVQIQKSPPETADVALDPKPPKETISVEVQSALVWPTVFDKILISQQEQEDISLTPYQQ